MGRLLITLLLVGCGSGHEASSIDDPRPYVEEKPSVCDRDDPRNVVLECRGDPRICEKRNRCDE